MRSNNLYQYLAHIPDSEIEPASHIVPITLSGRTSLITGGLLHEVFAVYTWGSGKHDALNQCCFNVGPPSTTLAQH